MKVQALLTSGLVGCCCVTSHPSSPRHLMTRRHHGPPGAAPASTATSWKQQLFFQGPAGRPVTTRALPVAGHKATRDCRSLVQSWVSPSEAITVQQGAGPHTPHPAPQEPVEESQSLETAVAATAHAPVTGLPPVTGRRHLSPFMRMCLSLGFKTRIPSLLSPPGDAEHG